MSHPKIPLQQTFDTIVSHLRAQNKRALDFNGDCVYRSPGGLKCAAGCLIPDDQYSPDLEGQQINPYRKNPASNLFEKLGHELELVQEFQRVHDLFNPSQWEGHFRKIALTFSLTYSEAQ